MIKKLPKDYLFEIEYFSSETWEILFDIIFCIQIRRVCITCGIQICGRYIGFTIYKEGDPPQKFGMKQYQESLIAEKERIEIQKEIELKYLHSKLENTDGHWRLKVDEPKFKRVYLSGIKNKLTLKEIGIQLSMSSSSVSKYARKLKLK